MKRLVITVLLMAIITSCKKRASKEYSHWYVNNDSFSSNNVGVTIGKTRADMWSSLTDNYFSLTFNVGFLPTSGLYKTDDRIQDPTFVSMDIKYNGTEYYPDTLFPIYLTADLKNGKASYTLPPTWFISFANSNDSISVRGTFNQP